MLELWQQDSQLHRRFRLVVSQLPEVPVIEIHTNLEWSNLKAAVRAAGAASSGDYESFKVTVNSLFDAGEEQNGLVISVYPGVKQ